MHGALIFCNVYFTYNRHEIKEHSMLLKLKLMIPLTLVSVNHMMQSHARPLPKATASVLIAAAFCSKSHSGPAYGLQSQIHFLQLHDFNAMVITQVKAISISPHAPHKHKPQAT
jgi:hypothetical protein